jgi:hypothetical protein
MILYATAICFFIFEIANAQEDITSHLGYVAVEALDVFESKDVNVDVSIGQLMLKQVAERVSTKNKKVGEALSDLKLVRVHVLSVDEIAMRMENIARYLDAMGWETTARSWKKRERVSVYLQKEADDVVGLFAMVHDRKAGALTLVNVVGVVQVDKMGTVGRELKVEAFDRIARLLPGYKLSVSNTAHHRLRTWKARMAPFSDIWRVDHEDFLMRYNRVDGVFVGWRLPLKYRSVRGVAHYGEVGYGFGSNRWDYRAGAEFFSFSGASRDNLVALGFELHGLTNTQDNWRIDEIENSIFAFLLRRDFRDYYRREGASTYIFRDFDRMVEVRGQVGVDVFESMPNSVSWNLFGDRWGSRMNFRSNPEIEAGQMRSVMGTLQLDSRANRRSVQGWRLMAQAEKAGSFLGGDFDFERYIIDVRRYQYAGRGTQLNLRIRAGTGRGRVPVQFLYRLGGPSSLRGYGLNAYEGDRMVLFNAIYWVDGEAHFRDDWPLDDVGIGVFFDAGKAWVADGESVGSRVVTSAGLGLKTDNLRVFFARPLDANDPVDWRVWVRFRRAF